MFCPALGMADAAVVVQVVLWAMRQVLLEAAVSWDGTWASRETKTTAGSSWVAPVRLVVDPLAAAGGGW